jgi:hypothetical protein
MLRIRLIPDSGWRAWLALAATVVLLLPACSGPTEPTLEDQLFGSWEWVRAEGGIAGTTITPESEGYRMVLRITRPDRIELSRDGTVDVDTRFEFVPAQDLGDISVMARLRYEEPLLGREEHEVGLGLDGELVLIDPCCDGFVYFWQARLE